MAKEYRYLFRFGRGRKQFDLLGPSVAHLWNDIYDIMDLSREMLVRRLDGEFFTVSEIKRIARDLFEDMEEDGAIFWLEIEDKR